MIFKRSFKPDRRRRKRQLLNTGVRVFTEFTQMDALGINLSDLGMCLFTLANLPLGSQIQVEFVPPRSTELVRVSGIVRHRALYLYGIEFLVDSDRGSRSWADAGTTILGRQRVSYLGETRRLTPSTRIEFERNRLI